MAYLYAVPKYAFGTAFELIPDRLEYSCQQDHCDTQSPDSPQDADLTGKKKKQATNSDRPPPSPCNKDTESNRHQHSIQKQQCDDNQTAATDTSNIDDTIYTSTTPATNTLAATSPHANDNLKPKMTERQFKKLLKAAVKLGCRHFDCAPLYGTQHLVGQVLGETIKRYQVPRQHFFITSKLPPNMMRPENIERSIRKSIEELQVNYLDLFLIHAPFATRYNDQNERDFYPVDPETGEILLDNDDQVLERAWLKLVDLKRKGLTRFIGLSNVNLDQLIRLNALHHVDVVQNEYHIYNQDRELFDYCEEIDVHFEAYAAFGSPETAIQLNKPCVFRDPFVIRVAQRHRMTVAEVLMQWIHQQPLSYVIRCNNLDQLEENFKAIRHCVVSVNDMIDLDTLNRNIRVYLFDEHKGLINHREYPFKEELRKRATLQSSGLMNQGGGKNTVPTICNKKEKSIQTTLATMSISSANKNHYYDLLSDDSGESSSHSENFNELKESMMAESGENQPQQKSPTQPDQPALINPALNLSNQSDSCESSTPTVTQTPPRLDVDDEQAVSSISVAELSSPKQE